MVLLFDYLQIFVRESSANGALYAKHNLDFQRRSKYLEKILKKFSCRFFEYLFFFIVQYIFISHHQKWLLNLTLVEFFTHDNIEKLLDILTTLLVSLN